MRLVGLVALGWLAAGLVAAACWSVVVTAGHVRDGWRASAAERRTR